MDCPKCGARNAQRAKFCQACGSPLTAAAEPAEPETAAQETTPTPSGGTRSDAFWGSAPRSADDAPRQWSFSPERFVVGDWLGAILACLVALVVMAALAAAAMGIEGYDAAAGLWFKRMLAFVVL